MSPSVFSLCPEIEVKVLIIIITYNQSFFPFYRVIGLPASNFGTSASLKAHNFLSKAKKIFWF